MGPELPYDIRYRLAYDGKLISSVLAVFLRAVTAWYRQQARSMGYRESRCGSVTFVQRFPMLDGVYVDDDEQPVFMPAPALSDSDVQQIVQTTALRVIRLCRKRGLLEDGQVDPLSDEAPLLAAIAAASIRGAVATGERAGQRLRRVLRDPAQGVRTAPLCFASRGFSLHAATRIDAGNLT